MSIVKPPSYFALNLQNKISLLELAKFDIISLLEYLSSCEEALTRRLLG